MIINKEEVEKAAEEYCKCFSHTQFLYDINLASFINGVKFSEEYVQKYVQDIIIENQGLKLYKDNEAERFKKLAIEFTNWYSDRFGPTEEDFDEFIKERK